MRNVLLGLVVLAGCGMSEASPAATELPATIELSAVNLADDCPPPKPAGATPPAKTPAPASRRPSDRGSRGARRSACDQTSMQLTLTSTVKYPTKVRVKKVELLDDAGKVLQVLTPRAPQSFVTDAYVAWDQQLPAGSTLHVMYALSAPNWEKLTKGRGNAHATSFQLRVTVAAGSAKQKATKTSIIPARLLPAVPT